MTALPRPHRLAFAAAHVVMRDEYRKVSHSLEQPGSAAEIAEYIDWEATASIRRHLDALGFGIAEAMDTAQRFQLGWHSAERLIRQTGAMQLDHGFIAGAGVDHLEQIESREQLIEGVVYQAQCIQQAGGWVILLPLPWLCAQNYTESEYVETYRAIIDQLDGPLFLHWLGPMFLPSLEGYFPGRSFERIMAYDPAKVRGAKLSLLDEELEVRLRRWMLGSDQILLTGDDFHFAKLILGGDPNTDETDPPLVDRWTLIGKREVALGDFSHALLGILDGIATPARAALDTLTEGDGAGYLDRMRPCETLGQWIFQAPTQHYKAGLAYLAWLNGLQDNPMLVNHEQRARSAEHYQQLVELAHDAGALLQPQLARQRMMAEESL